MGATSGAGTLYPNGAPWVFSGVRVTRSFALYVCFVDRCLSFNTFFFWAWFCLFLFNIRILITPLFFKLVFGYFFFSVEQYSSVEFDERYNIPADSQFSIL